MQQVTSLPPVFPPSSPMEGTRLRIEPSDELLFDLLVNRPQVQTLKLTNDSMTSTCAFKVRTTAPRRYCVKPNAGVVEPGEVRDVQVTLHLKEMPSLQKKDKFSILMAEHTEEWEKPGKDMWTVVPKESVNECKIVATFVAPKPDTIPEEPGEEEVVEEGGGEKEERARTPPAEPTPEAEKSTEFPDQPPAEPLPPPLVDTTEERMDAKEPKENVDLTPPLVSVSKPVEDETTNGDLLSEIDRLKKELRDVRNATKRAHEEKVLAAAAAVAAAKTSPPPTKITTHHPQILGDSYSIYVVLLVAVVSFLLGRWLAF